MLKRFYLVQAVLLLILCHVNAQPFTIEGKLGRKAEGANLILSYQSAAGYRNDTATVKNGKFRFAGTIAEPVKATLNLIRAGNPQHEMDHNTNYAELFLEPIKTRIHSADGNITKATIKAGKGQAALEVLQKRLQPAEVKLQPLMDSMLKYFGTDDAAVEKFRKQSQPVYGEMDAIKARFIADYPDSYLSLSLVKEKSVIIEAETFEPLFNALSNRMKNTATAKAIAPRLDIAKRTAIGLPAPDFLQPDTSGVTVSLSSLKGKYVLVDFWASWCGPCRQENQHLVKAYQKFSNRNFQIIGISLDTQKEAWLKAIRQDGLTWIQVSDLKGPKNEVAKQYDIRAVPQNFLVDPNGIIIARNLRSHELEAKLLQIFN